MRTSVRLTRDSARQSVAKNSLEELHRIGVHSFRKRYELGYRHLPLVALNHANHGVGSANTGRQLPLGQPGILACFGQHRSYSAGSGTSEGLQVCSDFQSTLI